MTAVACRRRLCTRPAVTGWVTQIVIRGEPVELTLGLCAVHVCPCGHPSVAMAKLGKIGRRQVE